MILPEPRELFIPDLIYVLDELNHLKPLDRKKEPDRWLRAVNADKPVVTAVTETPTGLESTSSSTAPWLMKQMISALDLQPGMKVLEIGTGTGWNAANMAAMGCEVTSVEIDQELSDRARRTLLSARCGAVEVITGDGELGVPERAPFDRVVVTAGTGHIPYFWVEQTRDGGRIVVPYSGEEHEGAMLVMTVSAGVAKGKVEGSAYFMPMRGQKLSYVSEKTRDDLRVVVGPNGQRFF